MSHLEAKRFDFAVDRHLRVFVCRRVSEGAPILYASHDSDGDWQFLCGGAHEDQGVEGPDGCVVACFECVVARDQSLNTVADLRCGWQAERTSVAEAWTRVDPHERFIHEAIERYGWSVQLIRGDEQGPAFAYTIGLFKSFGAPELIIFGLREEVMQAALNTVADAAKAGEKLGPRQRRSDVLEGVEVELREVRSKAAYRNYLGYARWFYRGDDFPVLQVVYPDIEGRFPGTAGVSPTLAEQQPLLE